MSDMEVTYDTWRREHIDAFRNIRIGYTQNEMRGYGLFATTQIDREDLIYTDEPLVCMQHIYSKRISIVCSYCLRNVGGFRQLANRILQNENTSLQESFPKISEELTDDLERQLGLKLQDPIYSSVGCECCFCSSECLEKASQNHYHRILCIEFDDTQLQKWKQFVRHACSYHENFILAGLTYCKMLCMVKYLGWTMHQAVNEFTSFSKVLWHQMAAPPKVQTNAEKLNTPSDRLEVLAESLALLYDCFKDAFGSLYEEWEHLFDIEFYSNLLGQFDMVNANVEYENPFNLRLMKAFDNPMGSQIASKWGDLLQRLHNIIRCVDEKDTEASTSITLFTVQDVFPPFMGTALFRTVSLTNHSCWPNAEIDFKENQQVHVTAIRSIQCGAEILQSYIDETLPLDERQKMLREYFGFRCRCIRCQVEAIEELLRRRGRLPAASDQITRTISALGNISIEEVQEIRNHRFEAEQE